jgi:hypothetical protein
MRSDSDDPTGSIQRSVARLNTRRPDATAKEKWCRLAIHWSGQKESPFSKQGSSARLGFDSASIPCGTTRRLYETQRPGHSRWRELKPQKRSKAIPPATDERAKDSHFRVAAVAHKGTDKGIA